MKSDSSARRFGAALLVAVVALSVAAVGIGPGGFAGTAAAADATEGSFTAGPQVAQSSPDGADDLVVNDVTADGEATLVVTYFDGDNNRILAGTTQVNSPSGADVQVDTQSATLGFRYKVFLMPRSEANSYVGGTSQGGTLSGAPTRDQFVALGTVQFVETSYSSFSDTDAEAESYTFSDAPPVSSVPIAATSEFTFDDGGGTFADEFSLSVSTRKLNPGETASSGAVIATSPLYDDRYPTRETTFEADLSGHLSQGDNTLYVNLHRGDGFSAPVVQKGATSTFSEPITVTLKRIDVQVTDLQTNAPVTEGEDLTVEATFTNEGNLDLIQYEDSVSATFGVDPSGGSSYATQQTLTLPDDLSETYGISAGESVSYTFTYSTSTGEAPNVGVRVTTDDDPDGVSKTATVEELTPDLQVTSVSPQDSGVAAGETLDVQATLDNQGNAQADGQTVTLEVDSNGDGSYTQVDSQTVTVADGATKDVTLSYNSQESDGSSVDVRVTTEDDTTGQTATASLAVPDSITGASVSFAGSGLDPEETATFTATVENTNGNAFQGLDVTFDTTGDGTLTAVQATSDSDGTVIAEYTPAVSDAGETVEVSVSAASDSSVDGDSAPAPVRTLDVSVSRVGEGSVDPAMSGSAGTTDVEAVVQTQDGDPLDGVDVSFGISTGNGALGTTTATTDGSGVASTTYTVGANDWDLGGVTVSASAGGGSDETIFSVAEPRPTISVTSASDTVAPRDTVDVTGTVTYEAPFGGLAVQGESVQLSAPESSGSLGTTSGTTDSNGEFTATYDPASGDFGSTVTVVGGILGTERFDETQFDVQAPVTVEATANLGVTAPTGTDVTFQLVGGDGLFGVSKTATTSAGDATVSVTFDEHPLGGPLNPSEYTVKVTRADEVYETGASTVVSPGSGETATPTFDLGARDATLDVAAALEKTAPETDFPVDLNVTLPDGSEVSRTVTLASGATDLSGVDSALTVPGIDHDASYDVNVSATGYDNATATASVVPGGSTTVDADTLAARNLTVNASAELGVGAPADGVDVTFTLVAPDGETAVATLADALAAGETVAAVNFTEVEPLDAGQQYTVRVAATGYGTDGVTGTAAAAPGRNETLDLGTLPAEDVSLTVEGSLGVTAPENGVDVTVDVDGPNGDLTSETVTVAAGNSAVSKTVSVAAVPGTGEYSVTLRASGYADATARGFVAPGESGTLAAGTLDAKPVSVEAEAFLNVPAPAGLEVTFTVTGPGETSRTLTATLESGQGSAIRTFEDLPALDYDESYEVGVDADGYETADLVRFPPGSPGASETVGFGTLPAKDVTLTVAGDLGVTAPEGGETVEVSLVAVSSGGETGGVGGELPALGVIERSLSVDAGDGTFSETVTYPAIPPNWRYVTVVATEKYVDAEDAAGERSISPESPPPGVALSYVAPGESATLDVGTLPPKVVNVSASATLGVTAPPGGTSVAFDLVGPDGDTVATQTTTVAEGDSAAAVEFTQQPALDYADDYTVTVDAPGYRTGEVTGKTPGAPNATESVSLGELAPEETQLALNADLGVSAPAGGVTVTVDVDGPSGDLAERTVDVAAGDRAFSKTVALPAVDAGETYDVTVSAPGYEDVTPSPYVAPGASNTYEAGTLAARDVAVSASADLGVTAPPGGTDVTFELRGVEGAMLDSVTTTVAEGDSAASVEFAPQAALDERQSYTVTVDAPGYETTELTRSTPGAPGADEAVEFGTLAAEDTQVTVEAALGVTAPAGGVDVTVAVAVPGGEPVERTVSLAAGDGSISETFTVAAIDAADDYAVTVSAPDYADATGTGYAAPGESGTVDAGILAPADVTVSASADLGVTAPPGGTEVTFELLGVEGAVLDTATTTVAESETTAGVEFAPQAALDESQSYTVTVDAPGFRTAELTRTTPGAPGASEAVEFGTLAPEDTQIAVEADLGVTAPAGGVDVAVAVAVPGGEPVERTVTLSEGESAVSEAFTLPAVDAADIYAATVSASGYEDATGSGYVAPGESGTVDAGALAAKSVTLTVDAALGVSAPADGVDATVEIAVPGGENRKRTVSLAAGESAISETFTVAAIDAADAYGVTVSAPGYADATTSGVFAAGGSGTLDAGTLAPDDVTVDATAALGVTAPPGGTDVTFELRGIEGAVLDTATTTVAEGGSAASVEFAPQPALGESQSYAVTVDAPGYRTAELLRTTPGAPGASETVEFGTLAAEDATLTVNAGLGVTAPAGGVDVTVAVAVPGGEPVERTVSLAAGDGSISETFTVAAIDAADDYAVTVSAPNYADATGTTYVAPGTSGSVDAGALAPEDVSVSASAELGVTAPAGGTDVTFELRGVEGAVLDTVTTTVAEGDATASVEFAPQAALDESQSYTVTVDAPGYRSAELIRSTPGAPGAEESVDFGTLAPEDVSVSATAALGVTAPPGGVDARFTLTGPGETSRTLTASLAEGESTASVTFEGLSALGADEVYTVTVDAVGYETAELARTTPGAPGAGETVEFGTLAAEDATLTVDAALGVTAPRDGFPVTVEVAVPGGETVTRTVELAAGESAVSETVALPAVDASQRYAVTVGAERFADATGATYVAPGESGTVDAGTLEPEDARVTVEADLGVTAPRDGFPVTVDVAVPGGEDAERTVELAAGESAISETVTVAAVDADESYGVTVSAPGYAEAAATGYVRPAGSGTLDAGTLAADDVELTVTATLGTAVPSDGYPVTVEVLVPGGERMRTVELAAGTTGVSETFALPAVDASDAYAVAVAADGYESGAGTTFVAPGESGTVALGTLRGADPTADAGPDRTVRAGLPLGFDASNSTAGVGVTNYTWTFGDGSTAEGLRPVHRYDEAGNYTVALTVTDASGDTATDTVTVTVESGRTPQAVLDANWSGPTGVLALDGTLALDASNVTDDDPIVSYEWSLGDGTTVTGTQVAHSYDSPGTYQVTLTVTDIAGNTGTETLTVEVVNVDEADLSLDDDESVFDGEAVANQSVQFDASDVFDDGAVTDYEWAFGDEATANGSTASHTFDESGTYQVTLTVTDVTGRTHTETVTVTVDGTTTGPVPEPAAFEVSDLALEPGTVTRGDGLGVTANVTNTGDEVGTRTVTLAVNGTALAETTLELDGGENATVAFANVDTAPLRPGTHDLVVNATDDAATATLTVESEERGLHESGVPLPVFRAVAGGDGVLGRADVLGMVVDYANQRPTAGVDLSREEVLALVVYYANQG